MSVYLTMHPVREFLFSFDCTEMDLLEKKHWSTTSGWWKGRFYRI